MSLTRYSLRMHVKEFMIEELHKDIIKNLSVKKKKKKIYLEVNSLNISVIIHLTLISVGFLGVRFEVAGAGGG